MILKERIFASHVYNLTRVEATHPDWQLCLNQATDMAIEQSPAYAAAESICTGLKLQRLIVYRNKKPIAFCHATTQPVALGLFKLIKITRGPVFMERPFALPDTKHACFDLLRGAFSRWRGKFVVLTPDLKNTPGNREILSVTQFHHLTAGFSSLKLDLAQSTSDLRKNLRSNWRNQLKKTEKSDLKIEEGLSHKDWLLTHYGQHLDSRQFFGETPEFVETVLEMAGDNALLLTALEANTPVAAVLCLTHGTSATYFISYTCEDGKAHNAHNLLLWEALKRLKKRGITSFDLGGINLPNKAGTFSTGLDNFKRGLGGEEYQLTGTFV